MTRKELDTYKPIEDLRFAVVVGKPRGDGKLAVCIGNSSLLACLVQQGVGFRGSRLVNASIVPSKDHTGGPTAEVVIETRIRPLYPVMTDYGEQIFRSIAGVRDGEASPWGPWPLSSIDPLKDTAKGMKVIEVKKVPLVPGPDDYVGLLYEMMNQIRVRNRPDLPLPAVPGAAAPKESGAKAAAVPKAKVGAKKDSKKKINMHMTSKGLMRTSA